jgi:hypothetical protein
MWQKLTAKMTQKVVPAAPEAVAGLDMAEILMAGRVL